MEENHVAAGILSVSTPSVNIFGTAESIGMARRLNHEAAEVAQRHPGRFGNFATLPMLDVDATLAEIAYCLDTRRAVAFVHPTDPADVGRIRMAPVAEWPFDICRAAIDLIY